ncbi:MAG: ABC transporter permease [Acidimicrobiia bacterium]|nr:ABC transporter permease [Acidimicrobiia bacterium]
MSRPVSRWAVVGAIVRKDLLEYGRDRLWVLLTVLVLVVVITLFWVLPAGVEGSVHLGVAGLPDPGEALGGEGLVVVPFASTDELRRVVAGEAEAWLTPAGALVRDPGASEPPPPGAERVSISLGIAFPEGFPEVSEPGRATVYVDAGVPEEMTGALAGLVREVGYRAADVPLPVQVPDGLYVVLGEDRGGEEPSAREGFRPLFVFMTLMMELFAMASLIAKEIHERTVVAVLVTPATVGDVLAAKGIAGAASGFVQAVILLAAINSLSANPGLLLCLLALGALLVAGTAMLAGSSGRDFMSTLFWGMLFMVPLLVPALAALFPGTAAAWVRLLPSYPLVRGLVEVQSSGAGWADTLPELGLLAAWAAGLFGAGWLVLRRRVRSA